MTKLSLLLRYLLRTNEFAGVLGKFNVTGNKFIVLWIVVLTFTGANSQELPQVTPPSPEAASLFKYMEYPVNFSTGLPQVNIPLYEIRSGTISVPISIGYHSSGRKVYDETGAIGLGWTLFAGGGRISRVMYGEPDDNDYVTKFPSPWKKQADIDPQTLDDVEFLEGVVEDHYPIPWYDTEYDFFSYSVNSISGKFIFKDENNVKVPVLIPKKPYKVEHHKATAQYNINYFDYINIIDDTGILYRFGKSLKDGTEYHETSSGPTGKTSWMLTEIISADKVDTVCFKYQSFTKNKRTISQKTTVFDDWNDCRGNPSQPPNQDYTPDDGLGTTTDSYYSIQRIKEIEFRNGTVKFNLASGSDLIESIHVINLKGDIVKAIDFGHTAQDLLSDGNSPTTALASLVMEDATENPSEVYEFEYYPTVYPQGYSVVESRFRDLWGYYNASGQLGMRPVVSDIQVIYSVAGPQSISIGDPSSARNPSTSATKSGVLRRITFPTGGSKEFIFQQNKFMNPLTGQITSAGGLRLFQTITDDGSGNSETRTYEYGVSESGYGQLSFVPNVNNMSYETRNQNYLVSDDDCAGTCSEVRFRTRVYSAEVLPIFSEALQRPVFYEEVVEYRGTIGDNIGKTVYRYDMGNQTDLPTSVQNLFNNSDYKYWRESSLVEKTEFERLETVTQPVSWGSGVTPADVFWSTVAHGNGVFVALSGADVMASSDGINWTLGATPAANGWQDIVFANGLFVAVADTGNGNRVMTSPDGVNWTLRTSAADNNWHGVTYGNGLFVAVARSGVGNRVMTSPDGINWTLRNSSADSQWQEVTYANGTFVAVAQSCAACVMTSTDGINWTNRTTSLNNNWQSVTYGNGLFVVVGETGTGNRVMTSPDGIVWTTHDGAADNAWQDVLYANGLFVAVATSGMGNRVMTSQNGIDWVTAFSPDNAWRALAYGNGKFVAVASSGTGNRAMYSTSIDIVYRPVRKTVHTYNETVYEGEKVWGLHVGKYYFITPDYLIHPINGSNIPAYFPTGVAVGCGSVDSYEVFKFSDYTISIGKKELESTTEIIFMSDGSSVATTKEYSYNEDHLISAITTYGSDSDASIDSDVYVTEIKYPRDFITTNIYNEMCDRNMLNYEIEIRNFRNTTHLTSTNNAYKNWGNNIIRPEIVSLRTGEGVYVPRIVFHGYDGMGNIENVSKDGGPRNSYLYGYKGELPIARIMNATLDQVFHTSFEDDEGNSGDNDCKTGRRSRTGGYNRVLSGLPDGIYNLTYFQKVGSDWEFVSVDNISVTNGTYSLSLSGQVDEIRFCPRDARVTTYSYDPLEGLISSTDENNITTYFERDTHQRLKFIRNKENDVVKQIDYHYKE